MSRERVDTLIERVMAEYSGSSKAAQLRYYEAVHQELGPLARELESENGALREKIDCLTKQLQTRWREASEKRPKHRTVYTCPTCSNVYRGGDQEVTVFAHDGGIYCRKCNPRCARWGKLSLMREAREEVRA